MLAYIGPVQIDFHGDPKFAWKSAPTAQGTRAASIGGYFDWPQAEQLSELVANRDRRVTIGGDTGVLEPVWSSDVMLSPFNGWYLLDSFSLDAEYQHSLSNSPVPVSLSAVYLGQRQVVVTRSDRDLDSVYGITPQAVVADPFYGGSFVTSPGGTLTQRAYDPDSHDPARVLADVAEMDVYLDPTALVIPCAVAA